MTKEPSSAQWRFRHGAVIGSFLTNMMRLALSLDALNFALAGAREGFGPFLGVYLQHQGFDPVRTGFAMSLAGIAGVAATTPLGALVDRITAKRVAVMIAVATIAFGAGLIVATRELGLVAVGQVLIGIADTSLAPLIAALTLGLVGRAKYTDRVARNEAFNHAGNAANAALAAALGYTLGLGYVALAIAIMATATTIVVCRIDPGRIDHEVARGGSPATQSALQVLWASRPLLVLAGAVFAFQTASGAMLPFIAQRLTSQGHDPSLTTGIMTVGTQVSMVVASLLVPRLTRVIGHGNVLAIAMGLVVVRATLAAWSDSFWCIGVVQVFEGVAMGFAGVSIPALVADIMTRSGHTGAGLGGVMTAFGAGAALSPALAGILVQYSGFPAAMLTLGGVALVGLGFWIYARDQATSRAAIAIEDGSA